ncbi:hypothetical protein CspeluHIS016_0504210 [Cutaneotrichosporon spelunceum]|uniref:Vacuolar protein-sorting-associated protein 36 n=1 Tax=Cutaneotrichosporon spelunceum TaxID=1672016 RepID=A0AAD3YDX4_9TREE|nr:hypothetical protein CspeluHIS016_0504210 [Cutaneotrichosporon spelunceum]
MNLPPGLGAAYWSTWELPAGASVAESLGDGEAWIGGWDGVGLYEGNNKVPTYQSFTLHITTHRVLLVPDTPTPLPLQCALSHVRETQFYAGFMRSSPKVIVTLGPVPSPPPESSSTPEPAPAAPAPEPQGSWTCGVCGFANPLLPGASVPPGAKCALCGVAYAMSKSMSLPPSRTTTPGARVDTPTSLSSPPSPSPAPTTARAQIACTACTFLNHPSLSACEICGTLLPKPEAAELRRSTNPPRSETVRFSFRRGGEREAYRRLKGVLSDRVWERVAGVKTGTVGREESRLGGIDAILKSISLEGQANDAHMQDAFRDLEVLMVRAGEMVRLAQNLNSKLTAAGGNDKDDEEATLVRSSLVRLGLPAPALTQDMVRDERAYFDGLARELGSLLTGGGGEGLMLQPGHGVIALDSVWGHWMRARGVALLPPATLMHVLPMLPAHTQPPIRRLDLPSGLTVLCTPGYAPNVLLARLLERMAPGEGSEERQQRTEEEVENEHGLGIIDIAAAEGLPIGLTTELVDMVAAQPGGMGIVRDDQAGHGGTKWYRDIISGWPLEAEA